MDMSKVGFMKNTKQTFEERLIAHVRANCKDDSKRDDVITALGSFFMADRATKSARDAANYGILGFGKYKGKPIAGVYELDKPYCEWLWNKQQQFLTKSVKAELAKLIK